MGNTWGRKPKESKAVKRQDVAANGGTLSGREARNATRDGGLGDDDRVHARGRTTGSFAGRTRKPTNEHGV